jgi:competence protein ComEC
VSGAGWSVLLPGDLEARGEAALLARSPADLRADVLVVPHHGSGSSSTPAFVAAVSPGHALIASGYRNRFRFPAPAVVARFQAAGTTLHDTARDGAVTVRLGASRSPVVTHYRVVERRFWHTPIE